MAKKTKSVTQEEKQKYKACFEGKIGIEKQVFIVLKNLHVI